MSYEESYRTATDPTFIGRVQAAGMQQALTFTNDDRPEFSVLADLIIGNASEATRLVWPVTGQPGITADSADPDLLAAMQAVWPLVGASVVPDTP